MVVINRSRFHLFLCLAADLLISFNWVKQFLALAFRSWPLHYTLCVLLARDLLKDRIKIYQLYV